jgi:hypothetical protein
MATTNTSLAPSPKEQNARSAKADPAKEAISPVSTESDRADAAAGRSTAPQNAPAHEEIAVRAYQCWHERGCPDGSPEVDWHRAEGELRSSKNR